MEMNRRWFLGGSLGIAGAVALPALKLVDPDIPVLWGDGIHDDADALNALAGGEPFVVDNTGLFEYGSGYLKGGEFLISRPVIFGKIPFHVEGACFQAASDFPANEGMLIVGFGEPSCCDRADPV